MFNYLLSVAVTFLFFGCLYNLIKSFKFKNITQKNNARIWWAILLLSALWFVTAPFFILCLLLYLFKMITDKLIKMMTNKDFKK